ncbi:MAG: acyltransferase [Candidatus Hydrogenedentes bacterium]|nr:acyltransferase [Candidatus Hydrogenedentota bacterium]
MDVKGHVGLGSNCTLHGNLVLRTHHGGRINLGDSVTVADYVMIQSNASVTIGDGVYVGPYTVIRDTNHTFHGTDIHWRLTPHITKPIHIEKNCYIGARTYILPGVTIGEGALIAPGSILTKNVAPFEVWAGAPSAQRIAHRMDADKASRLKRHSELLSLYGFAVAAEEDHD